MSEQQTSNDEVDDKTAPRDLDYAGASLAYSIIQSLLEHTRVTSDLIALMAQALDEDTTQALIKTPHWAAYLDSCRAMERTHERIEKFSQIMTELSKEEESESQESKA